MENNINNNTNLSRAITNPFFGAQEGFGEQYKLILYYMFFAELNHIRFIYTPFKEIAHNYDKDKDFVQKLEQFINLKGNIETVPLSPTQPHPNYVLENIFITKILHAIDQNSLAFEQSNTLKTVKHAFYVNKLNPYLSSSSVNDTKVIRIALHIRRKNEFDHFSHSGLFVPDKIYLEIIEKIQEQQLQQNVHCQFHIFSQGQEKDFEIYKSSLPKMDIVLHINQPLEDTFLHLVFADILVVSPSALSYTAGLISNGQIFYIHHCNPPLPKWSVIENYKSPRMYHKFKYQTTVYYDSTKDEFIIYKNGFQFSPLRIV